MTIWVAEEKREGILKLIEEVRTIGKGFSKIRELEKYSEELGEKKTYILVNENGKRLA